MSAENEINLFDEVSSSLRAHANSFPLEETRVFNSPSGNGIRTILRGGELWFVAKDVTEALGYVWKGVSGTINHVPEDFRGVCSVQTPSGMQEMAVLTEEGLNFFLMRSDKPKVKGFQRWIAGDVLPSIRKTGSYTLPSQPSIQEPPRNYRDAVAALLDTLDAKEKAEKELGEAQPAIEFHARISKADGEFGITEAAYEVGVKVPELVQFLISKGYALRRGFHGKAGEKKGKLEPTHYPISMGYMRLRMVEVGSVAYPQPVFTPKGVEWVSRHLRKAA